MVFRAIDFVNFSENCSSTASSVRPPLGCYPAALSYSTLTSSLWAVGSRILNGTKELKAYPTKDRANALEDNGQGSLK